MHHQGNEIIIKKPELAFGILEPSGLFSIVFDENIIGLSYLEELNKGLTSVGTVADKDENNARERQLASNATNVDDFNLSDFLKFEVLRGGEDSADIQVLNFNVSSQGVIYDELSFKIKFENPDYVSIGSMSDILTVEVVNPTFFSSLTTGTSIAAGFKI